MILQKLTLNNFRQFIGKQQIEFAFINNSQNANVTVIFGENGRGKTGIFRAIVFCLFGERQLSQDGDVPSNELQLVNVSALEKADGKPVEAFVELHFSHKGDVYTLRRSILGMQNGDEVIEEQNEIKLSIIDSSGNSSSIEPDEIDSTINTILDRRVKDYFLFDGEKIERLTRANADQRREIGKGIRNLLNVDSLEVAQKATSRLTKQLEKELQKNSSPELAKTLDLLAKNEQASQENRDRLDQIGDEAILAEKEIIKVDKELEAFHEIRELLDKRKSHEKDLAVLETTSKASLSGMKDLSVKVSSLLITDTIFNVYQHINSLKQKGDIPSEIRKDLIEKILLEKKCICGNEIIENTDAHKRILDWRSRTSDVSIQDTALNLWRHLSDISTHLGDDASLIQNRLIEHSNIRNEIQSLRSKIDEIRKEIGSSERKDAHRLEEHRKQLGKKHIALEAESQNLQKELLELDQENTKLRAKLKEEKLKSSKQEELSARATLARETRDALSKVLEEFTHEIKVSISEKATELFLEFLDSEGRRNLKKIIVNDDYSLQVLDRWQRPFLANISAGQRQIMSIAFIAALAQAASRSNILEMPLFMDTPFGRLSSEHRYNLIKGIPEFSSQWILLATDTEFRKLEARLLIDSKRWGKFYLLKSTTDGNTEIQERIISSVLSILKDDGDI